MPLFTDQMGRTILLDQIPRRIISLVPSQTELLYTLGLQEEVAGITKFCVHPEAWFRTKPRVGGTKNIRMETIHRLKPDLIIANKEENERDQIEELTAHYPVWISDVSNLEDALQMIRNVGELIGKGEKAASLAGEIEKGFSTIFQPAKSPSQPSPHAAPRAAYFIWRDPWMVAGGGTFINDMLDRCGLDNIFRNQMRYPSVTLESLPALDCEIVLLSSEPYPFREQHIQEIREILPDAHISLVDGELFSWYGSRMLLAPDYFSRLIPPAS
ncbi:ABC transporter substrate-binding protein [Flavitalea flava]